MTSSYRKYHEIQLDFNSKELLSEAEREREKDDTLLKDRFNERGWMCKGKVAEQFVSVL